MKKLISLFVVVIMMYTNIGAVASADTLIPEEVEPMICVKDVTTDKNTTTVKVEVWIENNPGISSTKLNVYYDEEMQLQSVEFNSAFGAFVTAPEPYTNPQPLSLISPMADINVSGVFATLIFDLSNVNPSKNELPILVEYDQENTFNENFTEVEFQTSSGKIVKKSESVTITFDGKSVETDGTILLGIDSGDGTYSLPNDVVGYYMAFGEEVKFIDAGKYAVSGGEIIDTVPINISVLNGAQVRYGGGIDESGKINSDNGLRFLATVDRSQFDGIAYGMKITAEGSDNEMIIDATKWQDETMFTVAITNLGTNNYNRNYTAAPFVKVEYFDGTEKTIYATETITRSVYNVATGLLKTGVIEDGYGVDASYGLYDVLNAYVNMVGVRLSMDDNGDITVRNYGEGAYKGEVFFDVSSAVNGDGSYTVTVTPIVEDFEHPVKIMEYWDEFVRINNNNTKVRANITSGKIENGILTFTFTRPQ